MDEKTMIKNLGILADYFLQVAIAERDKDIDLSFKCYQCSDMLKEVAERITPAEAAAGSMYAENATGRSTRRINTAGTADTR